MMRSCRLSVLEAVLFASAEQTISKDKTKENARSEERDYFCLVEYTFRYILADAYRQMNRLFI
jgi:hypothetical protein